MNYLITSTENIKKYSQITRVVFSGALLSMALFFIFPLVASAYTYNLGLIFNASPSTIISGSSSTLTWEAYYIDVLPSPEPEITCTASGTWSGEKPLTGSQLTNNLISNKTYTLTCVSQAGTSIKKSVTVTVNTVTPAPTVNITANPTSIANGTSSTLNWSSTNATSCTASGAWSGTKATSGSQSTGNLTSSKTYTLTCTGAGGSASDSATVTVASVPPPTISPNPALSSSCGLDIALVFDSSGSVDSTELGQMKNAFKGFINELLPATQTLFSVTDFDDYAQVLQSFTNDTSLLNIALSAPISDGATNWEDGLKKAFGTFDPRTESTHPNLIIFASDGNPTVNNGSGGHNTGGTTDGNDLNNAITVANTIKDSGTRILALGIGGNLNVNNLKAISSNDAVYTSNFDTLSTDLADIAQELCGGTITIKKLVDTDGNLSTTNDQFPSSGWEFNIHSDSINSFEVTETDGFTASKEVDAGVYKVTETLKEGFNKVLAAKCSIGDVNVGTFSTPAVEGISVGSNDIVSCVFINHKNEIPVITLDGPNPHNLLANDGPYVDPGFSASDLEDGDITSSVVIGGDVVDTTNVGTYNITYDVTDSDGGVAVQKTRTVHISVPPSECADGVDNDGDGLSDYPDDPGCDDEDDNDENTPPVITAEVLIILNLGSIFDPLEHATVEDMEDDPEPSLIVGGDTVDTSTIGDYTLTYDAIDSMGATAVQKVLTVQVRAQCADTVDNDDPEDDLADSQDPGCHTDGDPENPDSYDPTDNDETNPADVCANLTGIQLSIPNGLVSVNGDCVPPIPQCSDSADNDEDELIDTEDPGCHTDGDPENPDSYDPTDDDETDLADICVNIDGIQTTLPDGFVLDGNNCVIPQPEAVTVALEANPSDIDKGQNSELSWTSTNANVCLADWTSATSTSGTQGVSPENTTTYSISCGNGTATSTDEVTVTVKTPSIVGGGGGGGGGGGNSRSGDFAPRGGGIVLSASTAPTSCSYLRDYMRIDFNNDPLEVLKLQSFLISFEGHNNLSLTGVFDQATYDAVSAFQIKYFNDILEPWGHTTSTGYVYILTKKKINEIYCQTIYPLNQVQINEIDAFRQLLEGLRTQGLQSEIGGNEVGTISTMSPLVTNEEITNENGNLEEDNKEFFKGQNFRSVAGLIFVVPDNLKDWGKCLYEFLIILIIVYIIGIALKNVLYNDEPKNIRKRFYTKWLAIDVSLVISLAVLSVKGWWCPILPIFVALIISIIWTLTYPKNNSFRASIKSWYLVSLARMKSKPLPKKEKVSDKEFFKKELPKKEQPKETIKKTTIPDVIEMGPKK